MSRTVRMFVAQLYRYGTIAGTNMGRATSM